MGLIARLKLYFYIKPQAFFARRKHPVHQLLRGKSLTDSKKQSCIYFTAHKSATSFMSGYLRELSVAAGMVHIDYNLYFHTQGKEGLRKQQDADFIKKVFNNHGYFYGPLRYFVPVPEPDKYHIVLVVRDPRDILTSQYFSIKHSHPQITEEMIARRAAAQNMSVDEHALAQSDRFLNTFETYIRELDQRPNVLILRYEEMISDFPGFLRSINAHCNLQLNEAQLRDLDRSGAFKVTIEDASRHRRQVASGDYKEKLKPETIALLNRKFEKVLKHFGYVIE